MRIAILFLRDQLEAVAEAPATSGDEIGAYHHNDNDDGHRDRTEAPFDEGAPFQPDDAATRLTLAAQRLEAALPLRCAAVSTTATSTTQAATHRGRCGR